MEKRVYEFKCSECEKEISSLSEKQFNVNVEQHILSHKRKMKGGYIKDNGVTRPEISGVTKL